MIEKPAPAAVMTTLMMAMPAAEAFAGFQRVPNEPPFGMAIADALTTVVFVMMHSVWFPSKPAQDGAGIDDIVKIYRSVKIYLLTPAFRVSAVCARLAGRKQWRNQP